MGRCDFNWNVQNRIVFFSFFLLIIISCTGIIIIVALNLTNAYSENSCGCAQIFSRNSKIIFVLKKKIESKNEENQKLFLFFTVTDFGTSVEFGHFFFFCRRDFLIYWDRGGGGGALLNSGSVEFRYFSQRGFLQLLREGGDCTFRQTIKRKILEFPKVPFNTFFLGGGGGVP